MPVTFEKEGVVSNETKGKIEDNSSVDQESIIPCLSVQSWKGHESRVEESVTHFHRRFGAEPTFFVRVPGRVNLIGEHVDYCGYGVFPMAIEQDVFIAGRAVPVENAQNAPPYLRITNLGEGYEDFECSVKDIRDILEARKAGAGAPGWHLYFLCGTLGILEHLNICNDSQASQQLPQSSSTTLSMEFCVDGRVPPRAGLSSSSALVCASALATLVANNGKMSKNEIASLCAKSERYIGTEGGGMDQAIAFLATSGSAQHIEFVPQLHGEKVRLPGNAVFVIANSLAEANKAATSCYNMRVAECRLSTWILAKSMGVEDCCRFNRVKDLQLELEFNFSKMMELVEAHLHPEPFSVDEIAQLLDIDLNDLMAKPLMSKLSKEIEYFKLYPRIKHVLQEAERVEEFRRVCEQAISDRVKIEDVAKSVHSSSSSVNTLEKLGQLMNASHRSLQENYECSHPMLDQLVQLSQSLTHGARLTGAGWGGCMVALLDESQLGPYLEALKKKYYKAVHGIEDIGKHVFITQPGAGATIYTR